MTRLPGLGILWAGIGGLGFLLSAFLIFGLTLPGTWAAERSRILDAPPEQVFGHISDLNRWEAWTHWPELQSVEAEDAGGVGVRRTWDDSNYGTGSLTLTESVLNERVRYEVRVEGGIDIDGVLELSAVGGGTRLVWREDGAFGRNPLLRYTALSMDDLQGDEMDKALDRLAEIVSADASVAPEAPDGTAP